jgi:CHRD domain-containing protein
MLMKTVRNVLIGLIVSGVLAGIMVSCGGGGGYGPSGASTTPMYDVSGTLSGATGTVVLRLNGGSDMTKSNGPFNFASAVAYTNTYNVQVIDGSDRCTVSPNGAGTMGVANVTTVTVTCAAQGTQKVIRSAVLNGAQEGSMSSATGVGGVIVDPTDTDVSGNVLITGGITFSGVTATMQHIHQAPVGNPTGTGPVIIGLTLASDGQTAVVPSGARLTPAQYTALLAGELYFNVHSANNLCPPAPTCAAGEIRGQINVQGGVLASSVSLDNTQEVPASTSTATGRGTVIADAATGTVLITYITHNVSNASAAHIHTSVSVPPSPPCAGGPSCNGPVIDGFPNRQTNFDGAGTNLAYPAIGSQITQYLTDFRSNYLYFNVHSTNNLCAPAANCGAGEIRGNIAVQ